MEINKTPWCMSIEFKKCETTDKGWLTYTDPMDPAQANGITIVKEYYMDKQIIVQTSVDEEGRAHGNLISWSPQTGYLTEINGYEHGYPRSHEAYDKDGLGKLMQRTEIGSDGTTNGEQFIRLSGGRFELTTYKDGTRQGERMVYDPKEEELLVEEYDEDALITSQTLNKAKDTIYDMLHIKHPRDKTLAAILKNA